MWLLEWASWNTYPSGTLNWIPAAVSAPITTGLLRMGFEALHCQVLACLRLCSTSPQAYSSQCSLTQRIFRHPRACLSLHTLGPFLPLNFMVWSGWCLLNPWQSCTTPGPASLALIPSFLCCPGHTHTPALTFYTPCGTQRCVCLPNRLYKQRGSFPSCFPLSSQGQAWSPVYCQAPRWLSKHNRAKTSSKGIVVLQDCCWSLSQPPEVLSSNLNGFVLHKKLFQSACHMSSVTPSACCPADVGPAALTVFGTDRAGCEVGRWCCAPSSCQAEGNHHPVQITSCTAEGNKWSERQ